MLSKDDNENKYYANLNNHLNMLPNENHIFLDNNNNKMKHRFRLGKIVDHLNFNYLLLLLIDFRITLYY